MTEKLLSDEELEKIKEILGEEETEELEEGKKVIGNYSHENGNSTKVYKLSGEHNEGDPYHVKLFKNGKHHEPADYFTDNEKDAHETAKKMVKEETEELEEAKRGRPPKNKPPGGDGEEEHEHEHPIMQLHKVITTHGKKMFTHLDGKQTRLTPQLAQHAIKIHNSMKTSVDKLEFANKLHHSHESMRKTLGG